MKRIIQLALLLMLSVAGYAQVVTDNFSGTGALSGNWTTGGCSRVSGTAQPTTSGASCNAYYTGTTFPNDQYSQGQYYSSNWAGGQSTGPMIHVTAGGNAIIWLISPQRIYILTGGSGAGSIGTCPAVTTGDIVRLTSVGNTYTCLDVTTGQSGSGTDSTHTSGSPGFFVDQSSGGGGDYLQNFQAGNYATVNSNPTLLVTSTTGNIVTLTGLNTSWTAGTPGSPTFTVSGSSACSITAQTVNSTTSATLTMNAGGTQGVCLVNDPSILGTTQINIHTPQTWYIRTDGGTATQCTGHTNAAYPGSGSAQACALDHPFWLMAVSTNEAWRADYFGGDTVQFEDTGPYYIGEGQGGLGYDWAGAGINSVNCTLSSGHAFNCTLPNLPNGSSNYPTKWLGANTGACHTALTGTANPNLFNLNSPTIFSSVSAAFYGMSLEGSQWPDVECIKFTQPVSCTLSAASAGGIVGDSQSGTTGTFYWNNTSGQQPHYGASFGGEFVNVQGTSNNSGGFNFLHRQVLAGGGNTALNITGSQSDGTTATLTYTFVSTPNGGLVAGNFMNLQNILNCGGSMFTNEVDIGNSLQITNVTGTTFQITGPVVNPSVSCGFATEAGTAQDTSSGFFTIGGFPSSTVAYATDGGAEEIAGICGNAYTGLNYGNIGLLLQYTSAPGPSDMTVKDVAIEGMGGAGILGQYVNTADNGTSNVSYLKVLGDAQYGWNGDGGGCGTTCLSVGTLNIDHMMTEYNGMAEVIPTGAYSTTTGLPANGFDYAYNQGTGVIADGYAQIASGVFNLNITHSTSNYNTKNGFDLLHIGDTFGYVQSINNRNNWAEGNLGQTFKIGGNNTDSTNWDNVSIANCRVTSDEANPQTNPNFTGFPLGWNAGVQTDNSLTCRAAGDEWEIILSGNHTTSIVHNTSLGYGSTMWAFYGNVTSTTNLIFQDNINVGYGDPGNGNIPAAGFYYAFVSGGDPLANSGSVSSYNNWYGMRGSVCPQDADETNAICNVTPNLMSMADINVSDPRLTSGSTNVIHAGVTSGPTTDFLGNLFATPPSVGAFELGGSPPPTTITTFTGNIKFTGQMVIK